MLLALRVFAAVSWREHTHALQGACMSACLLAFMRIFVFQMSLFSLLQFYGELDFALLRP